MTTTPLHDVMLKAIKDNGPLRLDQFMAMALTDPDHGYYIKRKPFGQDGDFITAPEISQIFGELIGLWCLDQMAKQAITKDAEFVELGPGRGTLMADIMRAITPFVETHQFPIHLLEVSPDLQEIQRETLKDYTLHHRSDLSELPQKPCLFLANEFFDALPIRQFIRQDNNWFERLIDQSADELSIITAATPSDAPLPPADNGTIAEIAPDLPQIATMIAEHITRYGGAALIIDYGKDNAIGDSIQAVREHRPVDILDSPGETDLSAWVDFSAIKTSAEAAGARTTALTGQGDFLKALGLYHRAEQLGQDANAEQRRALAAQVDRLSSPAQMGSVFKVMAILPQSAEQEPVQDIAGFPATTPS